MKDPAFLFYSSDFIVGTMLMTYEQKGKYIELLCIQHQQGHLSEEDMLKVCGEYDNKIYNKFIKDDNNNYYNERLEEEAIKRKSYTESRRNNLKSKSHMVSHMKDHMENVNINENINKNKYIKYGEYKNVFFTNEQYEKLKNEFSDYKERIDKLDNYMQSKGVKYKDCLATIRNWAKKDITKKKTPINNCTKRDYANLNNLYSN